MATDFISRDHLAQFGSQPPTSHSRQFVPTRPSPRPMTEIVKPGICIPHGKLAGCIEGRKVHRLQIRQIRRSKDAINFAQYSKAAVDEIRDPNRYEKNKMANIPKRL